MEEATHHCTNHSTPCAATHSQLRIPKRAGGSASSHCSMGTAKSRVPSPACSTSTSCVAAAQMTITGELKTYEDRGESGDPVWRRFCGNCGSPILSDLPSQQGLHFVKAGTLDDVSGLDPKLHFWTQSAQPWVRFAEDAVKFDKTPG